MKFMENVTIFKKPLFMFAGYISKHLITVKCNANIYAKNIY